MVGLRELFQASLAFQRDLQLGQIQVAGVTEVLQELPIHDLREHLVAVHYAAIRGDVEDDHVGRDLFDDRLQEHGRLRVADTLSKQVGGGIVANLAIGQG